MLAFDIELASVVEIPAGGDLDQLGPFDLAVAAARDDRGGSWTWHGVENGGPAPKMSASDARAVLVAQRYGAIPVLWRAQAFALLMTAPMGLVGLGRSTFSWHAMGAMIGLGVLGTSLAYVFIADNAGRLGSTRASVATYAIPVVSLLLGVVIRNETVSAIALVGCGLAIVGAFQAGRSRH
jgi:hypothetical protein